MTRMLGAWVLRLGGWRVEGDVPRIPKIVIAIAPHTSNWDFLWLLMAKWRLGLKPRWLGKHTLFRPPLGWIMRGLGGIPVNRGVHSDVVARAVAEFDSHDRMMLALAPEGTRRYASHWKSGFHGIARGAGVPVVPVAIDYAERAISIGPPIHLTGDRDADMEKMRAFFAGRRGRRPDNQAPVKLESRPDRD